MSASSHFSGRTHVVMTQPSQAGNVGAAARALKTMGFQQLRLVRPKQADITQHPEAIAFASGAQDVLEQSKVYEHFEGALEGLTLTFALTARPRELGPQCLSIREAAALCKAHLSEASHHQVGIIMGTERTGLSNEQISHCHYICYIPANPEYQSLNVAQAIQIAAWELRYTLIESVDEETLSVSSEKHQFSPTTVEPLASQEQVERLLTHWQEVLEAIDFLDPQHPKKTMLKMRYWMQRSRLTENEVNMLRGVCTQVLKNCQKS